MANKMVDYTDVEEAKAGVAKLKAAKKSIDSKLKQLQIKVQAVLDRQKGLEKKKQLIKSQSDRTPRPDWHTVGDRIGVGFNSTTREGVREMGALLARLQAKKVDLCKRLEVRDAPTLSNPTPIPIHRGLHTIYIYMCTYSVLNLP